MTAPAVRQPSREPEWFVVDTLRTHDPVPCWFKDTAQAMTGRLRTGYDPAGRWVVRHRTELGRDDAIEVDVIEHPGQLPPANTPPVRS